MIYRVDVWSFVFKLAFVLDDGLETGQVRPDGQNLLQLMIVLNHDHVALGTHCNPLARVRRICCVDTSGKSTARLTMLDIPCAWQSNIR